MAPPDFPTPVHRPPTAGLPEKFLHSAGTGGGGVIQGTTSEAVAVALLAACARAQGGPAEDRSRLVAYASDQAHSCFKKAAMIVGIRQVIPLNQLYICASTAFPCCDLVHRHSSDQPCTSATRWSRQRLRPQARRSRASNAGEAGSGHSSRRRHALQLSAFSG